MTSLTATIMTQYFSGWVTAWGQRVNLGSSLTVPLLSSLHTVNQHYIDLSPPPATSTQLHLFFADQLHTHIFTHTHSSVLYRASSREETNHCSFYSISFHLLWATDVWCDFCQCVDVFTVCPAIIFVPLSDSHRKKGEKERKEIKRQGNSEEGTRTVAN